MAEPKSALERAIEARGRQYHPFEVQGFVGLGGRVVQTVEFRVPTKADEDQAVGAAHQYARQKCAEDEEARRDPDLLTDAKLVELLFLCCYQPLEQPAEGKPAPSKVRYPSFTGGPGWMRGNLTSDQIAILYNLLDSCRAKESPLPREIDFEKVETLARLCWASKDTDIPEAVLADRSRAYLTQAFTLLAMRYAKAVGWEPDDRPCPECGHARHDSMCEVTDEPDRPCCCLYDSQPRIITVDPGPVDGLASEGDVAPQP